jgi:cyclophilin family peptidyl-prolyl cis-trans isomerase
MKRRLVLLVSLALLLSGRCVAADKAAPPKPAPPKPGPKAEQFHRIHGQLNALLAKFEQLRIKYATANEDQRSDIQQDWKDLVAEGEKIEPKLVEAAEQAYAEAPNVDNKIADFLVTLLHEKVEADDYEPAAKIGKLLMDNGCSEKIVPNLAGIAAFAVSDFDTAQKCFETAAKQGFYQKIGRDDRLAQTGALFWQTIPYYKKAWPEEQKLRAREASEDNLPRVRLKTTKGEIVLELFEDQAPNTVANFISLVRKGFYNDLEFHYVVQRLLAQSGDPHNGVGGPGYTIACECYEPNHRNHFRGSITMAHGDLRDTGGSQFYMTFVPMQHLDGRNTVFGRVIKGMDVLAKLQRRDPTDQQAPRADKIISAEVVRKRFHEYKPQVMPD